TLSVLGKFDGKSDEGFLVGYYLNSKDYRVYNLVTKRVEVNLHVNFLEDKPNVKGVGYRWMFDIDYLNDSMNYIPVSLENQANPYAGASKVTNSAEKAKSRKSSTNSKKEEILTELQQEKKASSTNTSEDNPKILAFRREWEEIALKQPFCQSVEEQTILFMEAQDRPSVKEQTILFMEAQDGPSVEEHTNLLREAQDRLSVEEWDILFMESQDRVKKKPLFKMRNSSSETPFQAHDQSIRSLERGCPSVAEQTILFMEAQDLGQEGEEAGRFKQVEYKGVPHPFSGDYTPREQEDIDDSLYKFNGEQGTVSDHSVNDDPIPIPSIEQNWNQSMEREIGMAMEAAFKSTRVVLAYVRQETQPGLTLTAWRGDSLGVGTGYSASGEG
ncbi:hypothetical protein Tco_0782180, partial [Tanacetum coccineum]